MRIGSPDNERILSEVRELGVSEVDGDGFLKEGDTRSITEEDRVWTREEIGVEDGLVE